MLVNVGQANEKHEVVGSDIHVVGDRAVQPQRYWDLPFKPVPVGSDADVERELIERLAGGLVAGLGGADEVVVGDVERLQQREAEYEKARLASVIAAWSAG